MPKGGFPALGTELCTNVNRFESGRWLRKLQAKMFCWIKDNPGPYMFLTVTLPSKLETKLSLYPDPIALKSDWLLLKALWNTFLTSFRKLLKPLKYFLTTELTLRGIPHLHVIIANPSQTFLDFEYLNMIWNGRINFSKGKKSGSYYFNAPSAVNYIVGYSAKSRSWLPYQIASLRVFRLRIFSYSRGSLRSFKKDPHVDKPVCSKFYFTGTVRNPHCVINFGNITDPSQWVSDIRYVRKHPFSNKYVFWNYEIQFGDIEEKLEWEPEYLPYNDEIGHRIWVQTLDNWGKAAE